MLLSNIVNMDNKSLIFTRPVPYVDYEIFLGPIDLYDWEGRSNFNVAFALSLIQETCGHSKKASFGPISACTQ